MEDGSHTLSQLAHLRAVYHVDEGHGLAAQDVSGRCEGATRAREQNFKSVLSVSTAHGVRVPQVFPHKQPFCSFLMSADDPMEQDSFYSFFLTGSRS